MIGKAEAWHDLRENVQRSMLVVILNDWIGFELTEKRWENSLRTE